MSRKTFACAAGALLVAASAAAIDWNDPRSVAEAAVAASPSLREIDANLDAARARLRGAGALPNPMLMAGVQNQQIDPGRDPMTMYMVGASQTFVRGERREALQRAAQLDVERLQRERESRAAEVERDVLVANDDIAKLASMTGDAARARYEVGAAAQIDIIRSKVEANNIRHQVLMQRRMRDDALPRLRPLLNLSAEETTPPFSMTHAMEHHAHESGVSLSASTPAVAALEAEVARADEDVRLAKLAAKPDFSVEASYGVRPQETDMVSVVGRIELPIRKKTTIEPRIAEAVARREAARAQIDVVRRR